MRCDELLAILNEYIDGEIDPRVCDELEAHLAECDPCRVVVDNTRQTIRLYRNEQEIELPAEFRQRLHQSLRDKWRQRQRDDRSNQP